MTGVLTGVLTASPAAVTRRNEVGKSQLRLASLAFFLLAQGMKPF